MFTEYIYKIPTKITVISLRISLLSPRGICDAQSCTGTGSYQSVSVLFSYYRFINTPKSLIYPVKFQYN